MSINRLALYHVETLLWIDRLGSFSAAAARLNTSQPTISARVREVEAQLGLTLFRREGRMMQLTPVGRRLVQKLAPLWDEVQEVLGADTGLAGAAGLIRIGAGEIAAASCLPDFMRDLTREMPALSFRLDIDLTANMFARLVSGEIDIAFTAGPLAHPAIRTTLIGRAPLSWLASPETAARWQDGESPPPVWSLSDQSPLFQLMRDAWRAAGLGEGTINLCNNVRTMIDIVAAGGGIGLFPRAMAEDAIRSGLLVPIEQISPPPPLPFNVAIRAAEPDALVLEVFRRAGLLRVA